jgi:predicted MPP superfamily phosphohydrolase
MQTDEHKPESFDKYKETLEKLGVHFLINEAINMYRNDDKVTITGLHIDSEYYQKLPAPIMKTEYLRKIVGIPDNQCYNILIAHNPVYFNNYLEWGADLILSGHLHGGMVRLPGLGGIVSPQYKFFPRYDAGRFEESGKTMLVSRGLGTHTIKIRMFNRPELMIVTLER